VVGGGTIIKIFLIIFGRVTKFLFEDIVV